SNGYKILSFQTYKAVCLIPQVYRVSPPQPHGERHFIKSRSVVLTMPRLSLKVLRKPEIQIWI
uniref:hypothetical protein n=1 Tax=Phocaeicola vulgatus TaxID=821 RepID=UPI00233EEFF0|nr:hypothetical protein [Phocaeicola vulgatus]MDC1554282.1 hypothetical protein [Phocaeicola vulgatus]MDC1558532.1 hypothetical protein [Phocaeicola vulgatus]MDC1562826.1 hypothetical protein [Phocaeicola vulgatus]